MEKAEKAGVFLKHENISYPGGGDSSPDECESGDGGCISDESKSGKKRAVIENKREILISAENIKYNYPDRNFHCL